MSFNNLSLKHAALKTLECMDLTSLNLDDNQEIIAALCAKANSEFGQVAALCVYPQFIPYAKAHANVKIATVTNFPAGNADVAAAIQETRDAVALGADEVDVVFPYRALLIGDEQVGFDLVAECKAQCLGKAKLKVIIESGELGNANWIAKASEIAIAAGADFIKTSTGKVPVNATLEAARVMLTCIRNSGKQVGFKAAGGVKNVAQAKAYLTLAADIMGEAWVTPEHFRFGASGLLGDVLAVLNDEVTDNITGY
ncbi:Deoxyribose-phosphate aldolase [Pseudoalteromonas luteoviolacea B = ATCC 29581]|nr:Deoxyribose-phosphate aldolase [Pseudoalteromonas luteoviolacea B = ATCC 29581]